MCKRIIFSLLVAIILTLVYTIPVLAVPTAITALTATPSATSVYLKWTKSDAANTRISYLTTGFPANYAAGTSVYTDTGYFVNVPSLTAGTTYYFCAWGYDGANYSATAAQLAATTFPVAIPSGGTPAAGGVSITVPQRPASANQAPNMGGFNFEPFTSIISYFNSGTGGLGMVIANAWETLYIVGMVAIGMYAYIKTKNFYVAFILVFFITVGGVWVELLQANLAYAEVIVGLGATAIDKFML